MFMIRRGDCYLTYDDKGRPFWSPNKLDATRVSLREWRDFRKLIRQGKSKILNQRAGMNGYYEHHNGCTLQIFRKGRHWHARGCTQLRGFNPWTVFPDRHRSAKAALAYGRDCIDNNMI